MPWFLCLSLREFSRQKLCCFYIQALCCHALIGTYKKKLRSLSDISFIAKTLNDHTVIRTKSRLFPCAWAISPCIFKLRTVRFEPLSWTWTVSWSLSEEQEKHSEQNCRAASSSLLGVFAYSQPASSQFSKYCCHGTSLPTLCYVWLFSAIR